MRKRNGTGKEKGKGKGGNLSIGAKGEKRRTPCGWATEKELRKRAMSELGIPSPALFNGW